MPNLRPIQPVRISSHVYDAIEAAIVQGELGPGMALSDRHLAEMLGVSRTPVRDALHQLEATGLVERQGTAGWFVAGFKEQDVRELFELRRVFEPLGLKHLSKTWDEATVRELASFFDDFPAQLPREQYQSYLQHDHHFHKRIVGLSQNRRVIQFYGVIEKQIDRVRHYLATGYEGRIDDICKEHRRICEAIAARDLQAATTALLYHLHMGEESMIVFARERRLEQKAKQEHD